MDYKIGDVGPGRGNIFWVNSGTESGPKFMELAPSDWYQGSGGQDVAMVWALEESDVKKVQKNSRAVGHGQRNADAIDAADIVCGPLFQISLSTRSEEWTLPTIEELLLIYSNLHLKGLGDLKGHQYWSSSVFVSPYVLSVDFRSGEEMGTHFGTALNVRPVRGLF